MAFLLTNSPIEVGNSTAPTKCKVSHQRSLQPIYSFEVEKKLDEGIPFLLFAAWEFSQEYFGFSPA